MAYDYNPEEKVIMAVITGASNFACLPALILMILYERLFEFYIGLFTMITSFMYHVTESLDTTIYMEPGKWHMLDNVGSICCINSLLISLMSCYRNHQKIMKLNLFSLFFVLTLQTEGPWDLFNTIFPICVFIVIVIHDFVIHGLPKYNYTIMSRGTSILLIAIAMFAKGLDEDSDYMRLYHSMWHVTIGAATFYLWQVQEKRLVSFKEVFTETYHKLAGVHH